MLTPPDFFPKIILFRGGYYYAAYISQDSSTMNN